MSGNGNGKQAPAILVVDDEAIVRESLGAEIESERQAEINALKSEHEARIAEASASADRQALDRLTDRLLTLSGFDPAPAPKSEGT